MDPFQERCDELSLKAFQDAIDEAIASFQREEELEAQREQRYRFFNNAIINACGGSETLMKRVFQRRYARMSRR